MRLILELEFVVKIFNAIVNLSRPGPSSARNIVKPYQVKTGLHNHIILLEETFTVVVVVVSSDCRLAILVILNPT